MVVGAEEERKGQGKGRDKGRTHRVWAPGLLGRVSVGWGGPSGVVQKRFFLTTGSGRHLCSSPPLRKQRAESNGA